MDDLIGFLNVIENRGFHCDTLNRYDLYNNKIFYSNPIFFPYIDLYLVKEQGIAKPKWNSKEFCVVLSHDVDTIGDKSRETRRFIRRSFAELSWPRKFISVLWFAYMYIRRIYELKEFPIDNWMEFEDSLNVKSTFFFFPHFDTDENLLYQDCTYRFTDKINFQGRILPLYEVVQELKKKGWEVGIHGSILSARDKELMKKQKENTEKILGFKIKSIRQHYLSFEPEITPFIQKEAGFEYDSTYGSNFCVFFRAGTSFPFRWKNGKLEGVLELCPIIQEAALFRKRSGMGLDRKNALKFCRSIVDRVKEVGGVLTIIWHTNNFFPSEDNPADVGFLRELLNYCKDQGAWITSVENVIKYWQENYENEFQQAYSKINKNDLLKFISKISSAILKDLEHIL